MAQATASWAATLGLVSVPGSEPLFRDRMETAHLNGEPQVWHDCDYQVMTNSPPFGEQLELVERIDGFGGDLPLPGHQQRR